MRQFFLRSFLFGAAILIGTISVSFFLYPNDSRNPLSTFLSAEKPDEIPSIAPPDPIVSEEAEKYKIYSAVLKKFKFNRAEIIVIQRQTIFGGHLLPPDLKVPKHFTTVKEMFPSVSDETLLNYLSQEKFFLKNKLDIKADYLFVDEAKVEKEFVGNVVRLSHVGFNKNRTETFLYAELIQCPLCGGGDFYLLEKTNDSWKIKETFFAWVS